MEKKNFQRLIHTWIEKGKKAIVYNTKEGEMKGGLKVFSNHSIRACPRILFRLAFSPTLYKLLFGLRGLGSTPVLDSSQIWSLQCLLFLFQP